MRPHHFGKIKDWLLNFHTKYRAYTLQLAGYAPDITTSVQMSDIYLIIIIITYFNILLLIIICIIRNPEAPNLTSRDDEKTMTSPTNY